MANNLWLGAVRSGLAANMPSIPDAPAGTFGLYFATDTNQVFVGPSGGAWADIGTASAVAAGNAILANLPTEDPAVVDALWNDGGVLAISAGP